MMAQMYIIVIPDCANIKTIDNTNFKYFYFIICLTA